MLDAGEIDALISADAPKCILQHSPRVRRLFPDYERVERDYYKRTGIFPIMHTVVMRRQLLKEHPEVAQAVYKGFCDAKKAAQDRYRFGLIFNNMDTMLPWVSHLIVEDISVLGEDWWPYGIAANRKALEAVLRYHVEQGITDRHFSIEDMFAPEFLAS
jgi:4,5-dihydroxyphthalate decarboxylase